nr:DNA methyltransferase [Ferrimicrobium acidiphilum]
MSQTHGDAVSPPIDAPEIIRTLKLRLSLEGRKRVFEEQRELATRDIQEAQDPEEFTRHFLIDRVLFELLKLDRLGGNRKFRTPTGERKVDYVVAFDGKKTLIEAKPINADLYAKGPDGAVNQVTGLFTLAEVESSYELGIATDGLLWLFIGKNRKVLDELSIIDDLERIKRYLRGGEDVALRSLEEISERFYEEYNDILHGTKRISTRDCLVSSILHVDREGDREDIAQILVNRLIFIRFLQSVGLVSGDVLAFLRGLEEHELNAKLNQLFFEVMSTPRRERGVVDPHFSKIPYLNGSLFQHLEAERRNPGYTVRADVLRLVIDFLHKFRFAHVEAKKEAEGDWINPEILGYIFEKSLTASDRRGTGAYYTPREVAKYIAEKTILPALLERVNRLVKSGSGSEGAPPSSLSSIDEIDALARRDQKRVLDEVLLSFSVCDNACGSGAFLLTAAATLFNLASKLNEKLGNTRSPIELKKRVLQGLYGVDINPRAIEIARLRLWLWLVESYTTESVEPLPNIEYNLEVGNSLLGYVDIEQFASKRLTLDDFADEEETTRVLAKRFVYLKASYTGSTGDEARKLRTQIEQVREKLRHQLDRELFAEIQNAKLDVEKGEFTSWRPFHWGFEFYEVFDLEGEKAARGFDVVVGNPPYVDSERMTKEQPEFRDYLSYDFESTRGNWDLYIPFFERGFSLVRPGGRLCFISANKWLAAPYGRALRSLLRPHLTRVCSCDDIRVFKDAANSPAITFFKKASVQARVIVDYFDSSYRIHSAPRVERSLVKDENWGLLLSRLLPTLLRIYSLDHTLGEYCKVENALTTSEAYDLIQLIKDERADGDSFKLVNSGTIDPFEPLWGKATTSYIKGKFEHPRVARTRLHQLMAKRFELARSPKIVTTGIRYFEAFLDERGDFLAGKSTLILRDKDVRLLQVICALINSRVVGFFLRESYRAAGIDGGVNFNVEMIEGIPVPDLSSQLKCRTHLMTIYEEVTGALKRGDGEAFKRSIAKLDRYIYDAYDLTASDIESIEAYKVRAGTS